MGKDCEGSLTYFEDGHIEVCIRGEIDPAVDEKWWTGVPLAEAPGTRELSYSGKFELDEGGGQTKIIHHVEQSPDEKLIGHRQSRLAKIVSANTEIYLTLRPEGGLGPEKGNAELKWRKKTPPASTGV